MKISTKNSIAKEETSKRVDDEEHHLENETIETISRNSKEIPIADEKLPDVIMLK